MEIPQLDAFLNPPELIEDSSNYFLKWHANLLCQGAFNATWSESILKTAIDLAIKVSAFFPAVIGTIATFGFYGSWLIDEYAKQQKEQALQKYKKEALNSYQQLLQTLTNNKKKVDNELETHQENNKNLEKENAELQLQLTSLQNTLSESQENNKNLEKEKTELENKNASLETSLQQHKKLEEGHNLMLKNISNCLQSINPGNPDVSIIDPATECKTLLQNLENHKKSLENQIEISQDNNNKLQAKNREIEVNLRSLEKTLSESQENCKNLEKEKRELKNKNASLEASLEEHKKLEEDHKLLLKNISNCLQSINPIIPGILTIDQLINKLKDLQTWIGQYVSLEKKCKNLEQRNANWEKTAIELIQITEKKLNNNPHANLEKVETLADLRLLNQIPSESRDDRCNTDPLLVETHLRNLIRKLSKKSGRKSNLPLLPLSRPISEEGNEE
jgi:hypothetical protein